MNNTVDEPRIKTYEDLVAERKRIEMNIAINKVLLQREYDSVKADLTEKIRPIATTLTMAKRIFQSLKTPSVVIGLSTLLFNLVTRTPRHLR